MGQSHKRAGNRSGESEGRWRRPNDWTPRLMDTAPHELRLLWPELEPESPDQPLDNETAIIAERRAKVFRLYTRGFSIRAIAEDETLTCSKSTVAKDVRHVLDSYLRIALQDAAAHVALQLTKLAHAEIEALDAWERSKRVSEETELEESEGERTSTRMKEKKKQRDGNPQFLALYIDCYRERCKLLRLVGQDSDAAPARGHAPLVLVRGPTTVEPPTHEPEALVDG